ncbi:MAG: hypothetical protein WBW62_09740 [Solirubrobacterales bacterium]
MKIPQLGEETIPARSGNLLPLLISFGVLATLAVGLIAKANGVNWRAATQPLFILFDPVFAGWGIVAAAGMAVSLLVAYRLWKSDLSPGWFGLALFALTLASRLILNVARHGPQEWYQIYVILPGEAGRLEYLSALPDLKSGLGPFLDNFASLVPELPVHAAGHPPGMLVVIDWLNITTPQGLAALTIGVGAVATPILYALARRLFDERTARVAALLFVFVPTSLLYGATSADALFVTLALLSAALLLSKRMAVVVAGAAALALASFFSYALLAAGGWAGLVRWRRDGFRSMFSAAMLCAGALILFYGILEITTGFNVLAAIEATNHRYHDGIANVRPYFFWLFGSPAAFLIMLGPVAWYAAKSLASREITAVSLTAIIVVTALLGYTKAETERIWFFLVPLACLAAARALPDRGVRIMLAGLVAQAFIFQLLFDTRW